MGDVELQVGEGGAEFFASLHRHLADNLARLAVAVHAGEDERRLLGGVQAHRPHQLQDRTVAVGPKRQVFLDFGQKTLRAHSLL